MKGNILRDIEYINITCDVPKCKTLKEKLIFKNIHSIDQIGIGGFETKMIILP